MPPLLIWTSTLRSQIVTKLRYSDVTKSGRNGYILSMQCLMKLNGPLLCDWHFQVNTALVHADSLRFCLASMSVYLITLDVYVKLVPAKNQKLVTPPDQLPHMYYAVIAWPSTNKVSMDGVKSFFM